MIANRHSPRRYAAIGLLLATGFSACDSATAPTAIGSQLRVINVGSRNLEGLVVLFPSERVEFGDVTAGATTTYRTAGKGVFRYAAYEFRAGSRVHTQPVIDWVGEEPMDGEAFTYSVELVEGPSSGLTVRLVEARRDH